jgi:hypothetical protein
VNAGYVYALSFDNGTVKVGRTQNQQSRLRAHKTSARNFGMAVTGTWMSPLHVEWHQNEDALKVIAARCGGTPVTAEYFKDADYAAIVREAAGLSFTPPPAGPAAGEDGHKTIREMTPVERAVRSAALQEIARSAAWKAECAGVWVSEGVSPEVARNLGMDGFADDMERVLAAEAKIRALAS